MSKIHKILGVSLISMTSVLAIEATAADITKTLDLDGFSKISLDIPADIHITIGDKFSVIVEGNEKRIENTEFDVSGRELKIDRDRKFGFFSRGYDGYMDITIVMPDITSLEVGGSGNATIIGVDNEQLELSIDGSGDIEVKGKSERLEIEIDGSGDIEVEGFIGDKVRIDIEGSGDVYIDGTCNMLDIEIEGSGDVKVRDLKCKDVFVEIDGSGDAYVFASERFTFDSDGSGNVDLYGNPEKIFDGSSESHSNLRLH